MSNVRLKLASRMGIGDYLFLPVAPPKGGSVLASLGAAAALGAGAGVAIDVAAGRMGLNDPDEDPAEARRRRIRRGLYGAAMGIGASAISNLGTHLADSPAGVGKHLQWMRRAPVETMAESATAGGTLGKAFVAPGSTPSGRAGSSKAASWRPSDEQLKRMVMDDRSLPFDTKRILFRQIDEATAGRGRSASIDTLMYHGAGAVAGYFSAVAAGAGPVQRGISAVIGAMIGGAALNNKRSEEWSYTPGFKTYY